MNVLEIFKNTKHKKLAYDSDSDESYYTFNYDSIKQRFHSRINYLKKLKRKYDFPDKVEETFIKLLDFLYFSDSINYLYFLNKICDYYNIQSNIKIKKTNKKYEEIWTKFMKNYLIK